jgi:histidyl-tRNA synthetase
VEKWQFVERAARDVCETYGFKEIRTPIFEHTELFSRGIGDTTDIVQKEMFTFNDRGGRSLTLRPEATAAVSRAYLEHHLDSQPQPVKLYLVGPMFRSERPQAGRFHQFHQLDFETFGSHDPAVDAEIIACTWDFLGSLGLSGFQVELNSVGCPGCRPSYTRALREYYASLQESLCDICQVRLGQNPLRLLDCKVPRCQGLKAGAPAILDYLCPDCSEHFARVQQYLGLLDIPFRLNTELVRGLDYYTHTTFEVTLEGIGAQGSLAGGGRYNNLVEEIGGPAVPAIGAAIGLERVMLALEQQGVELPLPSARPIFVTVADARSEELTREALCLLSELRRAGYPAEKDMAGRSLKAQMKQAGRLGAKWCVIIGPDELQKQQVLLRDMEQGLQEAVPRRELLNLLGEKM